MPDTRATDEDRTALGSDPVPAISDAAATGGTALIFADLRVTLGVGVVNLNSKAHYAIDI